MKPDNLFIRLLKGYGVVLLADILCAFLLLTTHLFMSNIILQVLVGLCALVIYYGLLINFTYKYGRSDRKHEQLHKVPHNAKTPILMALLIPLPQFIMWIAFVLSGLGIIRDIYGVYNFTNFPFAALIKCFGSQSVDNIAPFGFILPLIFLIIAGVLIYVSYMLNYKDIDIWSKIIYKQDK